MTEAEAFAGKMPFLPEPGALEDLASVAQAVRDLHAAVTGMSRTIYGDARRMIRDRLPGIDNAVEAADALATSKAKVFTAEPAPPYSVGDLWPDLESQLLMLCTTARAAGAFDADDWESIGAVDDLTIERNASGELQLKDAGISTAKIAAGAVTGRFYVFEKDEFQLAQNLKYQTVASVSSPVSGAEILLLVVASFISKSSAACNGYLRLQYSADGITWENIWYNETDPGNPNTAEPADEGDETNPYIIVAGVSATVQVAVFHAHTPSPGTAYYRLQAKAVGYPLYEYVRSRGIAAFEFKR